MRNFCKLKYRYLLFLCVASVGLLLMAAVVQAAPVHIRILHVNDFHGYAEPHKPFGVSEYLGGAARLAERVKALRSDPNVPTLLLGAGDFIQGHPWTNMNQGKAVIDWMNLMKFDAMVVGNHEFDFGQEVLKARIAQANFPILGANVTGMAELKLYVIKTLGGVRVAIVGIVTEDTPYSTHPDNVKGLSFDLPAKICEKYLAELKGRSDVVVVLSHIGFGEDRRLAEKVQGINVIVGGHSHTKVSKPAVIGGTVIVQAWEHAKSLGVVDVVVEDGKVTAITARLEDIRPADGPADSASAKLVSEYTDRLNQAMDIVLGKTCGDLDGRSARYKETNMGDMIADAIRESVRSDVVLINSGGIGKNIRKGAITLKDVYSALPFDNYVIVLNLKGQDILRALEHGVSKAGQGKGSFPQVSGLTFTYDMAFPPGNRVKDVRIAGMPMDKEKTYTVAINDFMAAGGDGFTFLKPFLEKESAGMGPAVRDIVSDYIRSRGAVCPKTDGRIEHDENSGRVH
ncbi:MAG: 5'-nucleotidase / UDP-sugar diphosphatase [Syntrophus sp. SKADARSKE-3]|nr:5'-nucleotidase / UDP-sugar diphosphatase [Syntrophus sp. SKADARSKE-3]